MTDESREPQNAAEKEVEMRQHEREARERESTEYDDRLGNRDDDPGLPGNVQRGSLSS